MVQGDRGRLSQVVTNLISNAVKNSPHGSTVELSLEQREHEARVSVTDHGVGIPDEFRSRIFRKFSQADSSDARVQGGTGLGLNICKSLILAHGGSIDFESRPNHGCTFYFHLPLISS